jgi:hypothetical protein
MLLSDTRREGCVARQIEELLDIDLPPTMSAMNI